MATDGVWALCAGWCRTCDAYRPLFDAWAAHQGQAWRTGWVDVEEQADLLEPLEIENFPTLLLARAGKAVFCGPVPPHAQTLERLAHTYLAAPEAPAPALSGASTEQLQTVVQALLAAKP